MWVATVGDYQDYTTNWFMTCHRNGTPLQLKDSLYYYLLYFQIVLMYGCVLQATIPGILCGPLTAELVVASHGRWFPVFFLAGTINFTGAMIYYTQSSARPILWHEHRSNVFVCMYVCVFVSLIIEIFTFRCKTVHGFKQDRLRQPSLLSVFC